VDTSKRVHRFKNGICQKCGIKENFILEQIRRQENRFTSQIIQLIKEHPEKREELMESALSAFPCIMTDDELIIKDIIE
jgi:hypothetical protein